MTGLSKLSKRSDKPPVTGEGRTQTGEPLKLDSNSRLLTIPNVITLVRILLIPLFVYLGWSRDRLIASAFLLAFIGATDWIDGFLARRLNQVSAVGKVIDPSADRLLLIAAAVVAIHLSLIPLWLIVVIFVRELTVSLVVGIAALKFKTRLDVAIYGKAGTLLMMFGFPFFVLGGSTASSHALFYHLGYVFMIPGVTILFVALADYLRRLRLLNAP